MFDFPLSKQRSRRIAPKVGHIRSPRHMAWVAMQPCAVPGCLKPANVHHLRVPGADHAAGRRSGDNFAVPVCQAHHQGQGGIHHTGNEAGWWSDRGIDPIALAAELWARTGMATF